MIDDWIKLLSKKKEEENEKSNEHEKIKVTLIKESNLLQLENDKLKKENEELKKDNCNEKFKKENEKLKKENEKLKKEFNTYKDYMKNFIFSMDFGKLFDKNIFNRFTETFYRKTK